MDAKKDDVTGSARGRPQKVNFISAMLFSWLNPLMKKSCKKTLSTDDLFSVADENKSQYICEDLDREWQKELSRARRGLRPSYLRAILRCFWRPLAVLGLATAVAEVAKVFQPLFLAQMLHYFTAVDEDGSGNTTLYTYLYALATISTLVVISAATQPFEFFNYVVGMRMRVGSCALIYRKTLRLSQKALADSTTGHIVNLMSTDAARFDYAPTFMHYSWLAPIETAAVLAILWMKIGVASLPGFTMVLLILPLQGYMGKLFSRLRLKMASRTDERLQVMDQVLAGIKVIKLYCWEKPFSDFVLAARRREMKLMKIVNYLTVLSTEIGYFTFAKVAVGSCILTWTLRFGRLPSLDTVVILMRLIGTIQDSLVYCLPLSVQIWGEMITTCSRIQEFLLLEEHDMQSIHSCGENEVATIRLDAYNGQWGGSESLAVKDVVLSAGAGELLAVIGPVGSGKSSLLMAILGELPRVSGELAVVGRVAYAAQQPWIFSASLQQNILFGHDYDADRYHAVIEACALEKDLTLLPDGDQTLVGEKGVMLSGGQKARVGLARAVYRDADIYLLDDPLSALDAAVARHVFDRCIKGLLQGRLCVLVTHQVQYAREASRVLVICDGSVKTVGSCLDLWTLGFDLDELLSNQSPGSVGDEAAPGVMGPRQRANTALQLGSGATAVHKMRAESLKLLASLNRQYFRSTEALHRSCSAIPAFVGKAATDDDQMHVLSSYRGLATPDHDNGQPMEHGLESTDIDRDEENDGVTALLSSYAAANGTAARPPQGNSQSGVHVEDEAATFEQAEDEPEYVAEGRIEWGVYKRYFGARTNSGVLAMLVLLMASGQAGFMVIDWFLTEWSYAKPHVTAVLPVNITGPSTSNDTMEVFRRAVIGFGDGRSANGTVDNSGSSGDLSAVAAANEHESAVDVQLHIQVYASLICGITVLSLTRAVLFYKVCSSASERLHDWMLSSMLRVPMRFFDTNPVGRILNRFSSDIMYMDDYLPINFYDFITMLMVVVGTVVMAAAVNPWVLLPLFPIVLVLAYVRKVYASTSRAVKRLEAVTRSPVLSHLSTSIAGIHTVHAFGSESMLSRAFCLIQDGHTEAHYIFLCVNRWLAIRMDAMCISFVACVTLLSIVAKDNVNLDPSMFALTITYGVAMTVVFQYVVSQNIEVENMMTSVERILDYIRIPPEGERQPPDGAAQPLRPPPGWPHEGRIEAVNASLRYYDDGPLVLHNLNFSIRAGEKIGICGRTGAGKSSLLAMLFRLCEPEGRLMIDGLQITDLGLNDLRLNLSIIPQDPVLFSGTIRSNLDPFGQHCDDVLWDSIQQVQLSAAVEALSGGLDAVVSEGGSNFSVGQRQLLCLARALLRHNKILVIDEATANVDQRTSATIQETVRQKFAACTVLTIAHRLDSVMDSDRVMVLDSGRIEEFDEPHLLLQQPTSLLLGLAQKTGKDFTRLCTLAKEAFDKRHGRKTCTST